MKIVNNYQCIQCNKHESLKKMDGSKGYEQYCLGCWDKFRLEMKNLQEKGFNHRRKN